MGCAEGMHATPQVEDELPRPPGDNTRGAEGEGHSTPHFSPWGLPEGAWHPLGYCKGLLSCCNSISYPPCRSNKEADSIRCRPNIRPPGVVLPISSRAQDPSSELMEAGHDMG